MKIVATVCVLGVEASTLNLGTITKGMTGAAVRFQYEPDWDGLTRNVVFSGTKTVSIANAGDIVAIPPEVLEKQNVLLQVGVCGVGEGGKTVIPTVWTDLGTVKPSAAGDFPPPGAVTPDLVHQIISMIGPMSQLNTEARNNLVSAINEVLRKVGSGSTDEDEIQEAINKALEQAKASGEFDGEDGAPGKDGQDGYTPQKGIDYFDGKDGQPGKDGIDGKDGKPGAQGPQGIQGPSGPKGEDGAPGKSAYQYAVDGGYEGTEADFIKKMARDSVAIIDDGNGNVEIIAGGSAPMFTSRAVGILPTVHKGTANSELVLDFASSATGKLEEG